MTIQPNSFEYNFLFILTIILLAVQLAISLFLLKKVFDKKKERGSFEIDFLFGLFIMAITLFISRLIFTYFDFYLTKFDPNTYYLMPNILVWKLAQLIVILGFAFLVFIIDRKVLNFKFKGIFSNILIATALFTFFYPINSAEDFKFVSSILGISVITVSFVFPALFIYIGRTPGIRATAFMFAFGIIVFLFS